MAIGFYMYSNAQIITVTKNGDSQDNMSSDSLSSNSYLTLKRISQPHVLIYIIVFIILLVCFVLVRIINTFFPNFWSKMLRLFKCCEKKIKELREGKYKIVAERLYSNNIYKEITVDDLKREFEKC